MTKSSLVEFITTSGEIDERDRKLLSKKETLICLSYRGHVAALEP